jgi:hypothetical protein
MNVTIGGVVAQFDVGSIFYDEYIKSIVTS